MLNIKSKFDSHMENWFIVHIFINFVLSFSMFQIHFINLQETKPKHSTQALDSNILKLFQDSESLLTWGKKMDLLDNKDVIDRLIELETGMVKN